MHRLRPVRVGLPGRGHLRGRRAAGAAAAVHRDQPGVLRAAGQRPGRARRRQRASGASELRSSGRGAGTARRHRRRELPDRVALDACQRPEVLRRGGALRLGAQGRARTCSSRPARSTGRSCKLEERAGHRAVRPRAQRHAPERRRASGCCSTSQSTLHDFQLMRTELDALKGERTGHVKVAVDGLAVRRLPAGGGRGVLARPIRR